MELIEISANERSAFELARQALPADTPMQLLARRYRATFGPVTEIVEVRSCVHALYDREDGKWIQQFEQDVRQGVFTANT